MVLKKSGATRCCVGCAAVALLHGSRGAAVTF